MFNFYQIFPGKTVFLRVNFFISLIKVERLNKYFQYLSIVGNCGNLWL